MNNKESMSLSELNEWIDFYNEGNEIPDEIMVKIFKLALDKAVQTN